MWKKACDAEENCIDEAKEYNKKEYDKSHREPDFKEGYQVLLSALSIINLKGPTKITDLFVGTFSIIRLMGKNEVEVRLNEEDCRKHPVLPVSLVNPYYHTAEDKLTSRNKTSIPQDIVEIYYSPVPV
ncbi:hypothetical protein O181_006553 [Austropuccinia psidii MF-1]|uniref:Uncharacterized protein n=1 Tax=Austropuccinia psidii MF-1 TaxID=1389203 RepID=A0A9Q3GGP5_9BASI|nr:hypothetical protein [Austropuccinia psidii MF-1]